MNHTKHNKTLIPLGIFIVVMIISLNALGPYFKIQRLVTFGMIPLLFIIGLVLDIKSNINDRERRVEFIFLVLIYCLGIFTPAYMVYSTGFLNNFSIFTGAVLSAYIALALNYKYDLSKYFHFGFILSIVILIVIMYLNGNINFTNFATKLDFRDRFLLNANFYSYLSIFANFSLFYLYLKERKLLYLILLTALPVLFIIVAFTTQSRSGLALVVVINLCFWLFVHRPVSGGKLVKNVKPILFLVITIFSVIQFLNIYQGSRIQGRVTNSSQKGDSREFLAARAVEVFTENPFMGVGLGQFPSYNDQGLFSHNSYTEAMAEHGILGIFFLLVLHLRPFYRSLNTFITDPKNAVAKCNLLFFLTFLLYNNFYVFYKFPFSMMYFFLIIAIQNQIESKNGEKIKN